MTNGSEGGKPSPNDPKDRKDGKNVSGEKPQVAKTKLDINMGDLIDPLHVETTYEDPSSVDEHESKVAKTMLESDGPTLKQIKELSDSGKYSVPAKTSNSPKDSAPQPADSGENSVPGNLSDIDVDSLSPEEFKAWRKNWPKRSLNLRRLKIEHKLSNR